MTAHGLRGQCTALQITAACRKKNARRYRAEARAGFRFGDNSYLISDWTRQAVAALSLGMLCGPRLRITAGIFRLCGTYAVGRGRVPLVWLPRVRDYGADPKQVQFHDSSACCGHAGTAGSGREKENAKSATFAERPREAAVGTWKR